jgi:uncharacterized protein (DUF433 family)
METAAKQVYSHITKDPDVCGGVACIDGTRIRVMDIVSLKRRGETPEQMLEAYPSLTELAENWRLIQEGRLPNAIEPLE